MRAELRYRTILVPLDGSPVAEQALPHAEAQARCFGASLVVLRAVPARRPMAAVTPGAAALVHPVGVMEMANSTAEREESARYLGHAAEALAGRGIAARPEPELGEPAEVILRRARELPADLVVMTSHGHGGWTRALFGSVADRVLREAPCPVLVVRVGR
jgi:nucleotide-binding universal stress UspA family protein